MRQRIDGSFDEIKPFDKFKELFDEENAEKLRDTQAIFFGTEEDLKRIKTKKSIEDRLQSLEEKVKELDSDKPSSDFIILPTNDEIKKYGKTPMYSNMLKIMDRISKK
jgi:hypothetical protein